MRETGKVTSVPHLFILPACWAILARLEPSWPWEQNLLVAFTKALDSSTRSQVLLRKTMSGFQHQNPLPGSTDYLLHRGLEGGGGGRKLLDQAQIRLSHAPAGKLGGSWGASGTFVIQLQKSDAINICILNC